MKSTLNKIGVIGVGIIGTAIASVLQEKKLKVLTYDKYKNINYNSLEDLLCCDILFLCLPTPYCDNQQSFDKSSICEVLDFLSKSKYNGLIILKSTVECGITCAYAKEFNLYMVHNPEFLSERTAIKDFQNQKHIVIGKTSTISKCQINELTKFFSDLFPTAEISICTSSESELMKLAVNNFYATKIMFFNELYFMCQSIANVDYECVKNMMIKNGWIHPMHTIVPGTDGYFAYGGSCFPKDTNAFLQQLKELNCPHLVIENVIEECKILREK
jgi:UDPglucose 6-dehydrogenase